MGRWQVGMKASDSGKCDLSRGAPLARRNYSTSLSKTFIENTVGKIFLKIMFNEKFPEIYIENSFAKYFRK